jgi:hypothetical protein
MTRIKASEARQEFFRLLDAAEKGEAVIVERKGARFRLTLVPPEPIGTPASPVLVEDPEVLSGNWTWVGDQEGQLQFRSRRKKR